jgi:hypothetical protein
MTPTGWGPLVAACVVVAAATGACSDGDDGSDGRRRR